MSDEEEEILRSRIKNDTINEILQEEDLYKIIGAHRNASAGDLRRCYLERSKIVHPDKPPAHPLSTRAFQRLGFAFEILKTPSTRITYDRTTTSRNPQQTLPDRTFFLTPSETFQSAVATFLHDFLTGDFAITRRHLTMLQRRYPHLLTPNVILSIEASFVKIRELVLTTRTYALIIYIELGRIRRVTSELNRLGWLDLVGRTRLSLHLVRVTLAVPMRVDRALRAKEERLRRKEVEKLGAGVVEQERIAAPERQAGILNPRVSKVLEFVVGSAGKDASADEQWSASMAGMGL